MQDKQVVLSRLTANKNKAFSAMPTLLPRSALLLACTLMLFEATHAEANELDSSAAKNDIGSPPVEAAQLSKIAEKPDSTSNPVSSPSPTPIPAKNVDLKKLVTEPVPMVEPQIEAQVDERGEEPLDEQVEIEEKGKGKTAAPATKALAPNDDAQKSLRQKSQEPVKAPAAKLAPASAPAPLNKGDTPKAKSKPAESLPAAKQDLNKKDEQGLLTKIAQELANIQGDESQGPMVLLKTEVPPGTSTRLAWSPPVTFMGISVPVAVLVIHGKRKGPRLCLTAAVHGDELNGIEIVRRVMYDIDPDKLRGSIIGIPIVNIQGFRRASRYLPDRRDLNRFFPGQPQGSSAARIAYSFFTQVIRHCDYLIDLHTGSFKRTNLPQLRADLSRKEIVQFSHKLGSIVVVHSPGAEGSLRRAATEAGIPALTLEAGAPHELQKSAVESGVKSVESALDGLQMLSRRRFWQAKEEPVYYQSSWVRSKEGGILFSEVELGQSVLKGTVLGAVTDPITNARAEIIAPFSGRVIGMALNQVMYPGFAAYHIGHAAPLDKAVSKAEADQSKDAKEKAATTASEVSPETVIETQVASLPAKNVTDENTPAAVPSERSNKEGTKKLATDIEVLNSTDQGGTAPPEPASEKSIIEEGRAEDDGS